MTAAVATGGGGVVRGMEEGRGGGVISVPGGSSSSTSEGVTPLMYACQQGRDHTVRQILHRKPTSVQERDRSGKTALHYCAENQTLSCIDQVVDADPALLTARDEDGYTPLHLATIAGNKNVVRYLLSKGADVQALDNEKHTVIHWATVCGEVELLDLLIEAGANPSTPDIHGAYPLHYAAQMCGPNSEMGNDVRVGLLVLRKLLQHGVDVAVTDHDGRQPLLWAASAGNPFESRSLLLSGKTEPEIKKDKPPNEVRPSHVYCPSGSADAILALVNAGASVSAEDKDGLTALHCAASRGHLDCLDCLLSLCGAEVDTLDSNGCTPLFYAVTLGHADCTQLLLHHTAQPNRQDRKGRTPAHCGAAKGQLETLKLLSKAKADLWMRNVKGDLPLHEACQSGRKDLVLWLLSMRPDTVNAPNLDGRCPLHIAAINNNIEMCKILMDKEAAVNPIMRNSKGQLLTPLDAAVARSNRGCAKYLQLHGGVTASKLTDKHALQKAMQRALETSQLGSAGVTPTDFTGDELLSSSASSIMKSNRSTMTASPVNTESQTDDIKDSKKDGEDSKKPEHRDAQTGTSEVNIRKLVLEEEAELARKKAEEHAIKEENGEDVEKEEQGAEVQNGKGENDKGENEKDSADASSETGSDKGSESVKAGAEKKGAKAGAEKKGAKAGAESEGANADAEREGENVGAESEELKAGAETEGAKAGAETETANGETINPKGSTDEKSSEESKKKSKTKKVKKGKSKDSSSREGSKDESSGDKAIKVNESQKNSKGNENSEEEVSEDGVQGDMSTVQSSKDKQSKADISSEELESDKKSRKNSEDEEDSTEVSQEDEGSTEETTQVRFGENGEVIEEPITKTVRKKVAKSHYAEIPEHFEGEDASANGKENAKSVVDHPNAEDKNQSARQKGTDSRGEDIDDTTKFANGRGPGNNAGTEDDEMDATKHTSGKERKKSRKKRERKSKGKKKESILLVGEGGEGEELEISENGEVRIGGTGHDIEENGYEGHDAMVNGEDEDEMSEGDEDEDDDENTELSEGERSEDEDYDYMEHGAGEYGKQMSEGGGGPRSRPKSAMQPGMGKRQGKSSQKGNESKQGSSSNGGKSKSKTKSRGHKSKTKSKAGGTDKTRSSRQVSISDRPLDGYDGDDVDGGIPGKPPLTDMDERTHELMLESSGRDFLMVNDAAPGMLPSSPSSTHGRDTGDSGFKESGFGDYVSGDRDSDGPTDPERHTDDENVQHPTKRKTKTRRHRNKHRGERLAGSGAASEDADERSGGRKASGSIQGNNGDEGKPTRKKRDGRSRHSPNSRGSDEVDEGGDSEDAGEDEYEEGDEDALNKLGVSTHRRPGVRKGQARSGAMSGGPRRVENMESNLRRKPKKPTNASTEMSITQAMQTTMRKYALERRLFQQLLELKRQQIRNTRANEHVLIKRMVDAYQKEGNSLGLRGYSGPFNFASYEKYLYDQLRFLQSSQGTKIPTFKPTDDVEKLTKAIRRAEILELPDPLMTPRDPYECNHTTHRCHHAAHAYTGIPCAAYLGHRNRKRNKNFTLPRIPGANNSNGGGTSLGGSPGTSGAPSRASEPIGLRNYDPKKPLTVELQHGQARQQITLPTEILDKSKKYHLTFTIKPSSPTKGSQSPVEEEAPVAERAASAPEAADAETLPSEPRPEPHSAPPEGRTEA